jgi:hypothetical protein
MFIDGPVLSDRQQTDREDQNSHRLTMQNLEKYTDMLSRLKKVDEFSPQNQADFDERRSNSSSSSARRKNV